MKVKIIKILKDKDTGLVFSMTYLVAKRMNDYIELYKWIDFGDGPEFTFTWIDKRTYLALNELAYEDGFLV